MGQIAAALTCIAAMLLVLSASRRPQAASRLADDLGPGCEIRRPGFIAHLGAWNGAKRLMSTSRLERSMRAAGLESSADAIVGWKTVLAGGGIATVALGVPPPAAIAAGVLGFLLPDLWVSRAAQARRRALEAEVPLLLDCLVAASSSGLAAPLALRRSADAVRGPLADELAATFAAVDLGRRWKEALAVTSRRLDLPDLQRCIAVLTRTEVLGVPLASSLADLAVEVRASRATAAAERARAAPVKMLFPLVFLILPAFLLLTVVPVLLSTVRSIR